METFGPYVQMSYQVRFPSCLIITLLKLEFLAHLYIFMMSIKATFWSKLIITLWTLELLAHVHRSLMSSKVTFPSCLMITLGTLDILTVLGEEPKDITNHLSSHHNSPQSSKSDSYTCGECKDVFTHRQILKNHKTTQHSVYHSVFVFNKETQLEPIP